MTARNLKKLRENENLVYYVRVGATEEYCCNKSEWKIKNMFNTLVSQGADEKLLSEFHDEIYRNSREDFSADLEGEG